MANFVHLHVHTDYSLLDGACVIDKLVAEVKKQGMNSVAITDHGNMFGVLEFVNECRKLSIKPIIGCEVYVAESSRFEKKGREDRSGYHLILLAKNYQGYKNLSKLNSLSYLEGFYYKPRVDKELLKKYNEGLIALSACLAGEIPESLKIGNFEQAETILKQYLDIFGEDFYLELMYHGIPEQEIVNEKIIELSKKYNVPLVATNDVHFLYKEDKLVHDVMLCINTQTKLTDPNRMTYTGNEYFKTADEMLALFGHVPEAIENTLRISDKIEEYSITREIIVPKFPVPQEYEDEYEYLEAKTWEGAKIRYGEITEEVRERVEFELSVIKKMGFSGYFLIIRDLCEQARKMGVIIGQGRGSAAGSIVSYCNFVTNIDPLKYGLLFERFLNPDRISMPDVDIDFDDVGRAKVLQYIYDRYGKDHVAQIITYGKLKAKSAIKDVARVMGFLPKDGERLSKMLGGRDSIAEAFKDSNFVKEFDKLPEKEKDVFKIAIHLEGKSRQTGVHACGVIIGSEPLIEYVPLAIAKDKQGNTIRITQYEGSVIESVGLLKMDVLGLKTLSIIKDTLENIKNTKGIDVDIENIPLDDKKTFELFSRGETSAIFQFESRGMRENLKELKPNRLEDLIAMNALYRPGPMKYIPNYINRKHGKEKIVYDHPIMEEDLKETYGITVYQEQVMMLSRKMAGFTKGEADNLRKAMGKKQKDVMLKMKEKFINGCIQNNIPEQIAVKVWNDWEDFAQYAFNKSHATCYAMLAYQTAYLKANYPAEFMAAVLSNHSDTEDISNFLMECKKRNIQVLEPDVNESDIKFTVNKDGAIRYGFGAIKGVGEASALAIVEERKKNGPYKDFWDFMKRVNLKACNKKCLEALALSGAFDGFKQATREQILYQDNNMSFLDKAIRWANSEVSSGKSLQMSLFGDESNEMTITPEFPKCEPWSYTERLKKEKEIIGNFLSGHPLKKYELEYNLFTSHSLQEFQEIVNVNNQAFCVAGFVTNFVEKESKNQQKYCEFTIDDFDGTYTFVLYPKQYETFKKVFQEDSIIFIKGITGPKYSVNSDKNDDNLIEPKIKSIHTVSEVRENYIEKIILSINVNYLIPSMINFIKDVFKSFKGKTPVFFEIYEDVKNGIRVNLRSNKNTLLPCIELYNTIKEFNEFQNEDENRRLIDVRFEIKNL